MTLPFVKCDYPSNDGFIGEFKKILGGGPWTNNGSYLQLFEKELEKLLDTNVAVFNNGETALFAMLSSLGIKDKYIIVPSYTFVGTVAAIIWSGNYPLFCDIKSTTYPLINPARVQELLEEDIVCDKNIGAILGVDLYGLPCDYAALNKLGFEFRVPVLIDSAQSFGTFLKGKLVGSQCEAHTFSFHTTKAFHTLEGGAIASPDEYLIEKVKRIRNFGINPHNRNECSEVGLNGKMNEVQALIGVHKIQDARATFARKKELFSYYLGKLKHHNINTLTPPKYSNPMMNFIPIFVNNRDELYENLIEQGITVTKYWDVPVHRMSAYEEFCPRGLELPVTDKVAKKALALPFYNTMRKKDIDYIVEKIYGTVV